MKVSASFAGTLVDKSLGSFLMLAAHVLKCQNRIPGSIADGFVTGHVGGIIMRTRLYIAVWSLGVSGV